MKLFYRLSAAISLALLLGSIAPAAEANADAAWIHLSSTRVVPDIESAGGSKVELFVALEQARRAYREEGIRFWTEFPGDNRRYEWLLQTITDPPHYWPDLKAGAEAAATQRRWLEQADPVAVDAWDLRYVALRAAFMASAAPEQRAKLREMEFFRSLTRQRDLLAGHVPVDLPLLVSGYFELLAVNSGDAVTSRNLAIDVHSMIEGDAALERAFVAALGETRRDELTKLAAGWELRRQLGRDGLPQAFPRLAGGTVSLADLRGRVVLVDFWATHCSSCIAALPHLKAVRDRFRSQGFEVLTVCLLDGGAGNAKDLAKARTILAKAGVTDLDNAYLPAEENRAFVARYSISYVPTTWLFDRDGLLASTDLELPGRLEANVERALNPTSRSRKE